MAHFAVRLASAVQRCQNPVLVGLDPRADQLPSGLLAETDRGNPQAVADAFGLKYVSPSEALTN